MKSLLLVLAVSLSLLGETRLASALPAWGEEDEATDRFEDNPLAPSGSRPTTQTTVDDDRRRPTVFPIAPITFTPGEVRGAMGPGVTQEQTRPNSPIPDQNIPPLKSGESANPAPAGATPRPGGSPPPPVQPGANRTASISNILDKSGNRDMAQGTITVNGRSYNFNSGGGGNGYLPSGDYTVSGLQLTNQQGMVQGRGSEDSFGYKAILSDKYDSRVGDNRSLLRIHPDENTNGTLGCIGIVGDTDTQRQFYNDLKTELQNNGGSFTLTVQ